MERDSATESYHIYWPTDDHLRHVYAMSEAFPAVTGGDSFAISIDLMTTTMTPGQHMHVGFGETYDGDHPAVNSNWAGTYDVRDGSGGPCWTTPPTVGYGTWYSFMLEYDAGTQSV